MIVKCIGPISEISASDWDALGNQNDPFTTHAFLKALEDCGAVKPETGWQPVHMIVEQEGRAIAATPLYIKGHSYGEYIFDWGWAEASEARRFAILSKAPVGCAIYPCHRSSIFSWFSR